ncbi:MAG: hypothetical protein Kilf2KO_15760 [Rhodospirillales bacterium]
MKALVTGIAALAILLSGCSQRSVPLPANVSTGTLAGERVLDSIDYAWVGVEDRQALFQASERCAAKTLRFNSVILTDLTGPVFGPFTSFYYNRGNAEAVPGGSMILHTNKESGLLVGQGSLDQGGGLAESAKVVRYTVVIESEDRGARMTFGDIREARRYTGFQTNRGFGPVAATAPAEEVVRGIDETAQALAACMGLSPAESES